MTHPLRRALERFKAHPVIDPENVAELEDGTPAYDHEGACRWCVAGAIYEEDAGDEYDYHGMVEIVNDFTARRIDHAEAVARFTAIVEREEGTAGRLAT